MRHPKQRLRLNKNQMSQITYTIKNDEKQGENLTMQKPELYVTSAQMRHISASHR